MYSATIDNEEVCDLLINKGAKLNAINNDGQTALMLAARSGSIGACRTLLKHGANIHLKNRNGSTALMLTSSLAQTRTCTFLLEAGAPLEKDGPQMLSVAASNIRTEYCLLLINKGVQLTKKSAQEFLNKHLHMIQNPWDFCYNNEKIAELAQILPALFLASYSEEAVLESRNRIITALLVIQRYSSGLHFTVATMILPLLKHDMMVILLDCMKHKRPLPTLYTNLLHNLEEDMPQWFAKNLLEIPQLFKRELSQKLSREDSLEKALTVQLLS